jgi:hypothetical protein
MARRDNDIWDDYSCGNCGWTGHCDHCQLVILNDDNGDCELRCPECGSERVGEIKDEDFYEGNALHGKLWRGRKVLEMK